MDNLIQQAKDEINYRREFYKDKLMPYPESTHLHLISGLIDRLESLANAPKIEVTNEIVDIACREYHGNDLATPYGKQLMRAALEAAFSMQEPVSANNTQSKKLCAPEDRPDYGLRDFEEFHCKTCGKAINYQEQICVKSEPEKELISDGWIEWKGGDQPTDDDTWLEIRFADGDTCVVDIASEWLWEWRAGGKGSDIIAYRIISEPEEKKEPKNQALLDFVLLKHSEYVLTNAKFSAYSIFKLLSEYMELNK